MCWRIEDNFCFHLPARSQEKDQLIQADVVQKHQRVNTLPSPPPLLCLGDRLPVSVEYFLPYKLLPWRWRQKPIWMVKVTALDALPILHIAAIPFGSLCFMLTSPSLSSLTTSSDELKEIQRSMTSGGDVEGVYFWDCILDCSVVNKV